jgi:sugar phosphate isomerase/epimerase
VSVGAGLSGHTSGDRRRVEEALSHIPLKVTHMRYSRRDFGKLALAGVPAAAMWRAFGDTPLLAREKINSKINGVTIGAITYSFRSIPDPMDIIKAYTTIGLGEMELMSNHAEALAGMPSGRGGGGGGRRGTPPTPEQLAAREAAAKVTRDWRAAATEATFKPVRQKIADAGIDLRLLCYNMSADRATPNGRVPGTTDEEIEYAFMMAKWLGVDAISTSTQVSMAKRIAPFADTHKMMVGFHGHANTTNPDEVATPETFAAVMAASTYHGANLDIGHYTEAGYDPVAFIQQHHARITNLHLKDKKKASNGGGNGPWGTGDTPIKDVLKLVQKNKYKFPNNIEFEYDGDPVTEVTKCLKYCRDTLA